jgi:hypothetical protein
VQHPCARRRRRLDLITSRHQQPHCHGSRLPSGSSRPRPSLRPPCPARSPTNAPRPHVLTHAWFRASV